MEDYDFEEENDFYDNSTDTLTGTLSWNDASNHNYKYFTEYN